MKILFVEDDETFLASVVPVLAELLGEDGVVVARSKQSALEAVASGYFDVFVLDLRLPTADGALDEAIEHGQAVFHHVLDVSPGSLVFFLTGSSVDSIVTDLLRQAKKVDLWGERDLVSTVQLLTKSALPELLAELRLIARRVAITDEIEINSLGQHISLSAELKRVLRVFARRRSGCTCTVRTLSAGLSGSKVVIVTVENEAGAVQIRAVGKLGSLEDVEDEARRFEQVQRLDPGSFPQKIEVVQDGLRRHAGVFYRLADGFESSLFDIITVNPDAAAAVVTSLVSMFQPWRVGVPRVNKSVHDVRQSLLSDADTARLVEAYGLTWVADLEQHRLQVNWVCIHGDLHGCNVLVNGNQRPLLIDFGDVGDSASAIDPVMLELSPLFHPAAEKLRGTWPTRDNIAAWPHIDAFVSGCKYAAYIKACRGFSHDVSAGEREILAAAYAYVLRQLKYADTNKELALGLLEAVRTALLASYG